MDSSDTHTWYSGVSFKGWKIEMETFLKDIYNFLGFIKQIMISNLYLHWRQFWLKLFNQTFLAKGKSEILIIRSTFETFISQSFLKQLKNMSHFWEKTTNENNQSSKWETKIFNAILDQTKLWRILLWLWIRVEIMSEVALNLFIDFLLIKLLCRFGNFEVIKKKFTKWIKKDNEKL